MFAKLIGAMVGRRMAGRNNGAKGMMIGAAVPWIARRAFTPLGIAAMGGYAAKKYYDRRKTRGVDRPVDPQI